MQALLTAFGEAETFRAVWPSAAYLERLLGSDSFIALRQARGRTPANLPHYGPWPPGSCPR
jgi:hypothetical protein